MKMKCSNSREGIFCGAAYREIGGIFLLGKLCDYGGLLDGLKNLMIGEHIKDYRVVVGTAKFWACVVDQRKKDGVATMGAYSLILNLKASMKGFPKVVGAANI